MEELGGFGVKTFGLDLTCVAEVQRKLFRDSTYADLTVTSNGRTWKCHRAILCQRCPFFEAACGGNFAEAESKTIHLNDDPADGVDMLLDFLYTLEIPTWDLDAEAFTPAEYAFLLGDKYDITLLRDAGRARLKELATRVTEVWVKNTTEKNIDWISWFDRVWSWDQEESRSLRETIILALSPISKSVIELAEFQDLVWKNRDFGLAFIRAATAEQEAPPQWGW